MPLKNLIFDGFLWQLTFVLEIYWYVMILYNV